ncbi:hypothetical protein B4N84_15055 [Flavobacterium sp. IR1]|nr:hypothetical protein B4N84_15055 [Flavobacterium sp. IR1]
MKSITTLFILAILTSCNFQKSSEKKEDIDTELLNSKENNSQSDLGDLISTIQIGVKANKEQLQDFENGIVPWISIENPEAEISQLIEAESIIVPDSEITLLIDYPLNKPAEFVLKSAGKGFTKKQLILEISKKYHEIYKEEESTAVTKTLPMEKRGNLINRNETDGKYGVWGHDIGDLDLSTIDVYKSENGKITISLGVES